MTGFEPALKLLWPALVPFGFGGGYSLPLSPPCQTPHGTHYLRGVWGTDNLTPSFQPSAFRACAYVACTFVYRKGGLRLAVVGLYQRVLHGQLGDLSSCGFCSLPSPCKSIIADWKLFVKGFSSCFLWRVLILLTSDYASERGCFLSPLDKYNIITFQ